MAIRFSESGIYLKNYFCDFPCDTKFSEIFKWLKKKADEKKIEINCGKFYGVKFGGEVDKIFECNNEGISGMINAKENINVLNGLVTDFLVDCKIKGNPSCIGFHINEKIMEITMEISNYIWESQIIEDFLKD